MMCDANLNPSRNFDRTIAISIVQPFIKYKSHDTSFLNRIVKAICHDAIVRYNYIRGIGVVDASVNEDGNDDQVNWNAMMMDRVIGACNRSIDIGHSDDGNLVTSSNAITTVHLSVIESSSVTVKFLFDQFNIDTVRLHLLSISTRLHAITSTYTRKIDVTKLVHIQRKITNKLYCIIDLVLTMTGDSIPIMTNREYNHIGNSKFPVINWVMHKLLEFQNKLDEALHHMIFQVEDVIKFVKLLFSRIIPVIKLILIRKFQIGIASDERNCIVGLLVFLFKKLAVILMPFMPVVCEHIHNKLNNPSYTFNYTFDSVLNIRITNTIRQSIWNDSDMAIARSELKTIGIVMRIYDMINTYRCTNKLSPNTPIYSAAILIHCNNKSPAINYIAVYEYAPVICNIFGFKVTIESSQAYTTNSIKSSISMAYTQTVINRQNFYNVRSIIQQHKKLIDYNHTDCQLSYPYWIQYYTDDYNLDTFIKNSFSKKHYNITKASVIPPVCLSYTIELPHMITSGTCNRLHETKTVMLHLAAADP
ncbi:Hypothetical protein MVR_LOCUS272 [uncultured virus]|nr:Hypothetical protein MVR_LOCUS272 [uncultured virus]